MSRIQVDVWLGPWLPNELAKQHGAISLVLHPFRVVFTQTLCRADLYGALLVEE